MRKSKRVLFKPKVFGFNPYTDHVPAIKQIMEETGQESEAPASGRSVARPPTESCGRSTASATGEVFVRYEHLGVTPDRQVGRSWQRKGMPIPFSTPILA